MQQFISVVVDAHKKAWRAIRITIRIAAYVSLALVVFIGWEVAHGKIFQFDGVAHAAIPFGNPVPEQMGKVSADFSMPTQVAEAAQQQKAQHHMTYGDLVKDMEKFSPACSGDCGPRPAEKPPAPQKKAQ